MAFFGFRRRILYDSLYIESFRWNYGDICLYLDDEKQDCTIKSVEDYRFTADKVENELVDFIFWSTHNVSTYMSQHTIRKGMIQI